MRNPFAAKKEKKTIHRPAWKRMYYEEKTAHMDTMTKLCDAREMLLTWNQQLTALEAELKGEEANHDHPV
jgi:hypothetical protein